MTLILDFSAPDITANIGGHVEEVSALDTTGAPMLTASVTVAFDPQHPLVISPNQSTAFTIDVDLAAMNSLVYTSHGLQTTVQPFLSGSVIPVAETGPMRARGLLVIAQPSSSYYVMNIRPFADLVSALGAVQVNTSATTYFNVDGYVYVGATGLEALNAANTAETPVVAYGTLDDLSGITPTFNATSVYLGVSEESLLTDFITGTVGAINGDTLSLVGASYLTRLGALSYYGSVPVVVDSTTSMYTDGVPTPGLTTAAISVGQQITAAGQGNLNSANELESLDATGTGGLVRLQSTQLWGTLNSATTGSVSLDLLSINNFEPVDFNFTGTGSSSADDAVASSYRVDTGSLNDSALPAGTLLQVNGLVTPLGKAPPDFTASSVVQGSAVPSKMVIEFGAAGAGVARPFRSFSASILAVDLAEADDIHYIQTGPTKIDLQSLASMPNITYAAGTTLILAVGNDVSGISVFNDPQSFGDQLYSLLNGTNLFYRLVCVGQYDAATNTFVATRVDLALEESVSSS
jgi:hypothetical protein